MKKQGRALTFFWVLFLLLMLAGGVCLMVQGIRGQGEFMEGYETADVMLRALC